MPSLDSQADGDTRVFTRRVYREDPPAWRGVSCADRCLFRRNGGVYQPDIIVVARDRLSIIGEVKIEGAPDLVIEILSPSTAYYDLRHKKAVYARCGVKEYWIVDPLEHSIDIYQTNKVRWSSSVPRCQPDRWNQGYLPD